MLMPFPPFKQTCAFLVQRLGALRSFLCPELTVRHARLRVFNFAVELGELRIEAGECRSFLCELLFKVFVFGLRWDTNYVRERRRGRRYSAKIRMKKQVARTSLAVT